MLLAHRTLHCYFVGEGHIVLIECLQSWTDMEGEIPFPSSFEKLPLGPWEEGSLDVDTH